MLGVWWVMCDGDGDVCACDVPGSGVHPSTKTTLAVKPAFSHAISGDRIGELVRCKIFEGSLPSKITAPILYLSC